MSMRKEALRIIESYAKNHGLEPSYVGLQVWGDGSRYKRIKAGGGLHEASFDTLKKWVATKSIRSDVKDKPQHRGELASNSVL